MIRTRTLDEWLKENPEIESCGVCGNSGRIDCYDCDGSGIRTCTDCDGDGCDACEDVGHFDCDVCDGYKEIVCRFCEGKAKAAYHDALVRETELYRQWIEEQR